MKWELLKSSNEAISRLPGQEERAKPRSEVLPSPKVNDLHHSPTIDMSLRYSSAIITAAYWENYLTKRI